MVLVVKNLPANARHTGDIGSVPESGRPSGEGHGNPLQYSCLVNPVDRGAWWSVVHMVAESDTTKLTYTHKHVSNPTHTHTQIEVVFKIVYNKTRYEKEKLRLKGKN